MSGYSDTPANIEFRQPRRRRWAGRRNPAPRTGRQVVRLAAIVVMCVASMASGCMQVPPYHEPAGYSSTYHRHLKQTQGIGAAQFSADPVWSGSPPPAPSR